MYLRSTHRAWQVLESHIMFPIATIETCWNRRVIRLVQNNHQLITDNLNKLPEICNVLNAANPSQKC